MSVTVPLNNYIVEPVAVPDVPTIELTPLLLAPEIIADVDPVPQQAPIEQGTDEPELVEVQLTPLMQVNMAYAESLYKPYQDAIAAVETVEPIKAWLPQVYSAELTQQLLFVIDSLGANGTPGINDVRQAIGDTITEVFFNHRFNPDVTPWSLTVGLSEEGEKLFGSPATGAPTKLPVIVAVGPTQYVHELDQDTTYGILLGLQNNPGIKLYVAGLEVTEEMLAPFYIVPPQTLQTKTYSAVFYNGRKQFDSMDVVTGYITSSEWLGLNPRVAMRDMRQLNVDANGIATFIPLAF